MRGSVRRNPSRRRWCSSWPARISGRSARGRRSGTSCWKSSGRGSRRNTQSGRSFRIESGEIGGLRPVLGPFPEHAPLDEVALDPEERRFATGGLAQPPQIPFYAEETSEKPRHLRAGLEEQGTLLGPAQRHVSVAMRPVACEQGGVRFLQEVVERACQVGQASGVVQVGRTEPRDPELQVRGLRICEQGSFHLAKRSCQNPSPRRIGKVATLRVPDVLWPLTSALLRLAPRGRRDVRDRDALVG